MKNGTSWGRKKSSLVDVPFLIKYIKHSMEVARLDLRNRSSHLNTAVVHQETEATKPLRMTKN